MGVRICYPSLTRSLRERVFVVTDDAHELPPCYYVWLHSSSDDHEKVVSNCMRRGTKYLYSLKIIYQQSPGVHLAKWVREDTA